MSQPLLGEFDPSVLRKRPGIRLQVMEESRILSSDDVQGHSYRVMVSRLFQAIEGQNVDGSTNTRRLALPSFSTTRKGKKTVVANFVAVCEAMKRPVDNVKKFICVEQNTDASVDEKGSLIMALRMSPGVMERLIGQYVQDYVRCKVCGAMDTEIQKNGRIFFVVCKQCTAQRSVQAIKAGFKANTTRRRARPQ